MARNFNELRAKMSPEARARADLEAKEQMTEMLFAELGRLVGLNKKEGEDDMQISTLRRLVEALGGQLEVIVHMPGATSESACSRRHPDPREEACAGC